MHWTETLDKLVLMQKANAEKMEKKQHQLTLYEQQLENVYHTSNGLIT